jgi:hypothetical protein
MDAFEHVVGMLLERQGYWIRPSFKVELTKEEKRLINRFSSPRWELDLVAYKGASNDVLVVECKSYLDSRGVTYAAFAEEVSSGRYKLFTDKQLRETVLTRLIIQLTNAQLCAPSPNVTLCLAVGRFPTAQDRAQLHTLFEQRGWRLFDDEWIYQGLADVAKSGYENDIAIVVSKILLRR